MFPRIREKRPKKKCLNRKSCKKKIFAHKFWDEDQKKKKSNKKGLHRRICKKRFLLTNSGVMISILRVSCLKLLHSRGTEPVTFFEHNPRLGGTILVWRGTSSDLGGARPQNAPRGAGPGLKGFQCFICGILKICFYSSFNQPDSQPLVVFLLKQCRITK